MLPAYGFAVLRSGSLYESASSADYNDNQCSFYMNFGRTRGHGHSDALNLNILAYGLNIAPDFGYPDSGNSLDPARSQWQVTTLSHNTVVVNESEQQRMTYNGTPLHFDGDSRVRVMDADTPRLTLTRYIAVPL